MLPMKAVRLQLGELLAADDTTLAPAVNANIVRLIIANFAPDEDMDVGDLTFATFTGSAAKSAGTGTQQTGIDPGTGQQVVTLLEPAGGWRWECTAAPDPAQTIYGYALLTAASAALLGVQLLETPVTISEVGHQFNAGTITMTLLNPPTETV